MQAASRSCGLKGAKLSEFINKFLFHIHSEGKVCQPKRKLPTSLNNKKIPYLIPPGCTVKHLPILQELGNIFLMLFCPDFNDSILFRYHIFTPHQEEATM